MSESKKVDYFPSTYLPDGRLAESERRTLTSDRFADSAEAATTYFCTLKIFKDINLIKQTLHRIKIPI